MIRLRLLAVLLTTVLSFSLAACGNVSKDSGIPLPSGTGGIHTLSLSSDVRVLDKDWSEYRNNAFGFSFQFPTQIYSHQVSQFDDAPNPRIALRVVEQGEVLMITRGYYEKCCDEDQKAIHLPEDLSLRKPYYDPAIVEKYYPALPFQMYFAQVSTKEDVEAFVKRAYGSGCVLGSESTYDGQPGLRSYWVERNMKCPGGFFPDAVFWHSNEGVVFAQGGISPFFYGYADEEVYRRLKPQFTRE